MGHKTSTHKQTPTSPPEPFPIGVLDTMAKRPATGDVSEASEIGDEDDTVRGGDNVSGAGETMDFALCRRAQHTRIQGPLRYMHNNNRGMKTTGLLENMV